MLSTLVSKFRRLVQISTWHPLHNGIYPQLSLSYLSRRPLLTRHSTATGFHTSSRRMGYDDADRTNKVELVKQHVKSYPDFPKKGILFRDIFSVFNNVEATRALDGLIADHVKNLQKPIDAVIGLESRGFLFGPQIAAILSVPFVPARKKGKLPGELLRLEYSLEYGTDILEVQKESLAGKKSVLIVDDLLATGGTMRAAVDLVTSAGADVVECFVIMELAGLGGRMKIPVSCHSLISYD